MPPFRHDHNGQENVTMERASLRFYQYLNGFLDEKEYWNLDHENIEKTIGYLRTLQNTGNISESFRSFGNRYDYQNLKEIRGAYLYALGINTNSFDFDKLIELDNVFTRYIEALEKYQAYMTSSYRHCTVAKEITETMNAAVQKAFHSIQEHSIDSTFMQDKIDAMKKSISRSIDEICSGDPEANETWVSSGSALLLSDFFKKVHEYMSWTGDSSSR